MNTQKKEPSCENCIHWTKLIVDGRLDTEPYCARVNQNDIFTHVGRVNDEDVSDCLKPVCPDNPSICPEYELKDYPDIQYPTSEEVDELLKSLDALKENLKNNESR